MTLPHPLSPFRLESRRESIVIEIKLIDLFPAGATKGFAQAEAFIPLPFEGEDLLVEGVRPGGLTALDGPVLHEPRMDQSPMAPVFRSEPIPKGDEDPPSGHGMLLLTQFSGPEIGSVQDVPKEPKVSRAEGGLGRDLDGNASLPLSRGEGQSIPGSLRPLGPHPLPFAVRSLIETFVTPDAVPQAVFVNPLATEVLDRHAAEAVTVGERVFIASPSYALQTDEGAALVAHEAAHLAQNERQDANTPRERERQALAVEQTVLDHLGSDRRVESPSFSVPASVPKASAARPQFAAESRIAPEPDRPAAAPPMAIGEQEMSRIKEEVYRDLIARLRSEAERGA
jgi:hypothetical protein